MRNPSLRWGLNSALARSALCIAFGWACASPPPLPWISPVTEEPTQVVKAGKFVWVDLVTQDVERAKSFYGELFGWTFDAGDRYTKILHQGTPIAGIVQASDPERGSEWVGNLSVPDVDRAAALVSERGGVVERGPLDAPDRGRLALVSDPEGALLLLLRASGGDPPDADPPVGRWLWRELWTHDAAAAVDFYAAVAGYEAETIEHEGQNYHVFKEGDVPRAGVVDAPPQVHPLWLPYVRVADAQGMAARAASRGGRVVMQSERAAILVDPTGAAIGIQFWSGGNDRGAEEAQ